MELIIVGASGLVGTEFIKLLENSELNFKKIYCIGSEKSKGNKITIKDQEYEIKILDEINWNNNYYIVNCADKEQAKFIFEKLSLSDSIMIDNSSQYRMTEGIPLVIPEINFPSDTHKVIANPNCSTIILDLLLKPLLDTFGLKRVVVSTYQAASGAGKDGLNELLKQTEEMVLFDDSDNLTKIFWKKQYVYNTFVHNSNIDFEFGSYNEEETKIIKETQKILENNIPITATCIRVPVLRSHCESVNVELNKPATYEQIIELLKNYDYLEIMDNKQNKIFPETITSSNQNKVQVGHIREDFSINTPGKAWNFWISGDQLLRGAAANAFIILEKLIKNNDGTSQ